MSFGGSVAAMMQMIKENRKLLKGKRNRKFRSNNIEKFYSKEKGEVFKFKEVSTQELIRINEKNRRKIKKAEQKLLIKVVIFILLSILLLIYLLK